MTDVADPTYGEPGRTVWPQSDDSSKPDNRLDTTAPSSSSTVRSGCTRRGGEPVRPTRNAPPRPREPVDQPEAFKPFQRPVHRGQVHAGHLGGDPAVDLADLRCPSASSSTRSANSRAGVARPPRRRWSINHGWRSGAAPSERDRAPGGRDRAAVTEVHLAGVTDLDSRTSVPRLTGGVRATRVALPPQDARAGAAHEGDRLISILTLRTCEAM